MSLTSIMNIGLSGLTASQTALRTVSNNVANVNTEDFARRETQFVSQSTAGVGNGVSVATRRIADQFLAAAAYRAAGDAGAGEVLGAATEHLSALIGAPGDEYGLSARLNTVTASAIDLSAGDSEIARRAFLDAIDAFFRSTATVESELVAMRRENLSSLESAVAEANRLTGIIARTNAEIAAATLRGEAAGAALDRRASALSALGDLLSIRTRTEPNAMISVSLAGGMELIGREATPLRLSGDLVEIETVNGAAALTAGDLGGRIGAHVDLAYRVYPGFSANLAALLETTGETLNAVHNRLTAVPPPQMLEGRASGLVADDLLGLSGMVSFTVADAAGSALQTVSIGAADLPPGATIADLVMAINAAFAGRATASFNTGELRIAAANAGEGIIVGGDAERGNRSFADAFGLNDLVSRSGGALPPAGLRLSDTLGAAAGETLSLAVKSSTGSVVATMDWISPGSGNVGDFLAALNAGALAAYGSFSLAQDGVITFTPSDSAAGIRIEVQSDSTQRADTGRSISSIFGLTRQTQPSASDYAVSAALAVDPSRLALHKIVSGRADVLAAADFSGALRASESSLADFVGRAGSSAAAASASASDAAARLADAAQRRAASSGVNLDEEMARLIVFQNSYSAAARVITAARDMYDILLRMGA